MVTEMKKKMSCLMDQPCNVYRYEDREIEQIYFFVIYLYILKFL